MEMSDKTLVLSILHLPRLGLAPEQIADIERIMDGAPREDSPIVLDYEAAAIQLGLKARNRKKTVALWVRKGLLSPVYGTGRYAVGVTADSVREFARARRVTGKQEVA